MAERTQADRLFGALLTHDRETALALLSDTGGPCKTRDLLQTTEIQSRGMMGWVLAVDGKRETVTAGLQKDEKFLPLVSITQDLCRR